MKIVPIENQQYGAEVYGFDAESASDANIQQLKNSIYKYKILLLKNQAIDTDQFVQLGGRLGTPEAYYQPMYHHPKNNLIFVSSNTTEDGTQIGVPKTGKFWHGDYSFMPKPFAFTMIYPQKVPSTNRGTHFIDMAEAYKRLSPELKRKLDGALACHSVKKYFKIRPVDVYRPISEVLAEVERETPSVYHPAVFLHPLTGEKVLYVSEGFTQSLHDVNGNEINSQLLKDVLEQSGQLDEQYTSDLVHLQKFSKGDLMIWDNRRFIHRALHSTSAEPSVSYRLTLHDHQPFYSRVA
jgi:Probable taurine catabolism dioxygenase